MSNDYFPFKDSKWVQLGQKFNEQIELEGIFSLKDLSKYQQQIIELKKNQNNDNIEKIKSRREFVMVGRSNSGKSSLINSLVESNVADISNYPGKTRNLFFFKVAGNSGAILVDSPGYGMAKRSVKELQEWGKMMTKYFSISPYLHRIILLIDSQVGAKEYDHQLLDMLQKRNKQFVLAYTKVDKINEKEYEDRLLEGKKLYEKYNMCSPFIHFTSSKTQYGLGEIRSNLAYSLKFDILSVKETKQ